MKKIAREELQKSLDNEEEFFLIEALPAEAYNAGHIPGAFQMTPEDIQHGHPALPADKNTPIVTYCGSSRCPKSRLAAEALEKRGYTNVSAYEAGKEDWKGAGLMLEMEKAAGTGGHLN